MVKILICGDSFAADWTVKFKDRGKGWPNFLAEKFQVTNMAMAGCGEYKIYNQLLSQNLDHYDFIIVSHTSAYRIHTQTHPVHFQDKLHSNADLIYSDIKEHSKNKPELKCIVEYYEKYFDLEYSKFVHSLVCDKIKELLKNQNNVLHLTNLDWKDFYQFPEMLILNQLTPVEAGMNHYDQETNYNIYKQIVDKININLI
jgi:hypothetical protein